MLAACDSGSGDSSASAPAATSDGPTGELSANDATEAEFVAAFEAAGITNASQWAHEVEEYRPYPADDPDFAAGGHLSVCPRRQLNSERAELPHHRLVRVRRK